MPTLTVYTEGGESASLTFASPVVRLEIDGQQVLFNVELMSEMRDVAAKIGVFLMNLGPTNPLHLRSIESLGLDERATQCLLRCRVKTVGELVRMTENELLNITNFGQKSLDTTKDRLEELGLSLAP